VSSHSKKYSWSLFAQVSEANLGHREQQNLRAGKSNSNFGFICALNSTFPLATKDKQMARTGVLFWLNRVNEHSKTADLRQTSGHVRLNQDFCN
jgi:hypothetical protein